MTYLLLSYDAPTYWHGQTPERDDAEEGWFADFCGWLRSQGISWESSALDDVEVTFSVRPTERSDRVESVGPLVDTLEVISGYFVLDVPIENLAREAAFRSVMPGWAGVELRKLTG